MATIPMKHEEYKIQAEFHEHFVAHTTYTPGAGGQPVGVTARWRREKQIGTGAFGAVWLEKEEGSGRLRAVKRIPKQQLDAKRIDFLRELDALARLRDVSVQNMYIL